MIDRRTGGSILGFRGRLAASIFGILLVALVATYVAVYRGTGSDLRGRIDSDLTAEAGNLALGLRGVARPNPEATLARANRLVAARTFGPTAEVLAISVPSAGVATNQPELLGLKRGSEGGADNGEERSNGKRFLSAPAGFSTLGVEETGDVRVLTLDVTGRGARVATIRAGEPLAPVDRALEGLNRTFFLIGAITLIVGALAGYLLAARTARPLRRMSRIAGAIDAGELGLRMDTEGSHDEVGKLAESFNHMLERLQDAFDRQRSFTSDASHELRTPLTVIRGQIEVLAREPDPSADDIERVSGHVMTAVGRMQRLVADLLLLAETDEGIHLRRQTMAVDDLIALHADAFEGIADREFRIGDLPPGTVDADPDRIGQVLSNLISNAIDHTEAGGVISLSAHADDGRLTIDIDDDGPGIPPAERELIFDRLHRTDSSRARRRGGSGLGLAIARALVRAHGGTIRATDSPFGGARLEVRIPGYRLGSG